MPAQLDTWLELTKEEVLDPSMPICDPHHHLWDLRGKPGLSKQTVYLLPEILEDMYDGHNVVKTVFTQAYAAPTSALACAPTFRLI